MDYFIKKFHFIFIGIALIAIYNFSNYSDNTHKKLTEELTVVNKNINNSPTLFYKFPQSTILIPTNQLKLPIRPVAGNSVTIEYEAFFSSNESQEFLYKTIITSVSSLDQGFKVNIESPLFQRMIYQKNFLEAINMSIKP